MRKQLRNKRRACALCKPHKRGWVCRWSRRDRAADQRAREQLRQAQS